MHHFHHIKSQLKIEIDYVLDNLPVATQLDSSIALTTENKCTPSLCGVDSGFCTCVDETPEYRRLLGFQFDQSGYWSTGCARNLIAKICNNKDQNVQN